MSWRRMKWCNPNLIILLLVILPVIVVVHGGGGGFNNNESEVDVEEEAAAEMSMELVHRHDARRFAAEVDRAEAVRGFIVRDTRRRQRMNQRWGLRNHRRKEAETVQFQSPMHSGRDDGLGEYFVQVKVGTPAQKFWLAADSASEFTWFNCVHKPHNKTEETRSGGGGNGGGGGGHKKPPKGGAGKRGKRYNPCKGVFCPRRSRTFQAVNCSSHKCKLELSDLFSLKHCPKPSDPCLYDISYVDGSSAKGFFGIDTITVHLSNGRKGKLHGLTIGCTKSMHNGVTFNEDTGGILGLGYAKDAFVDKAVLKYGGGKFSYCLVDHLSHQNVSSYLTFGSPKVKLLTEMRRTELFLAPPYYGVIVVGISVGGQMLKVPSQVWDFNAKGGTIVDSGTTLTNLALPAYEPLLDSLNKSLSKVKRVVAEEFGGLDFCFDGKGFDESTVPRLVFHFAGGARFEPPVKSYIIDVAPGVKCIGVVPIIGPGASVIGNIMQQNHVWEFDLAHNTVGFAPSTCL